jgi:putative restriction endonuclease
MPRDWTRDELVLAMNLYGRLRFGQFHARHPLIVDVAARMDRTPGALAMKLCNLASLDPAHAARGVKGLTGASALDRRIWTEFENDWESLGMEGEARFNALMGIAPEAEANGSTDDEPSWHEGPTETMRSTIQRLGQQIFRRMVLVSYDERCCITGIPIPALLTASHIVRWADDRKERLNPRNGLCLAKTQDAAFDRHLITLDEDLRVVLSESLRDHFSSEAVRANFAPYEGKRIEDPHRFAPDQQLLARHRAKFCG